LIYPVAPQPVFQAQLLEGRGAWALLVAAHARQAQPWCSCLRTRLHHPLAVVISGQQEVVAFGRASHPALEFTLALASHVLNYQQNGQDQNGQVGDGTLFSVHIIFVTK